MMRLVAFSVKNYRSIVEAYKLLLGNYSVLVGPNNEGKSNIVKAIALSLSLITRSRPLRRARLSPVRYYRSEFRFDYDWARDFPISLQNSNPTGRSEFTLEFKLEEDDFQKFRRVVGVNLSTNLKIKLGFGIDDVSFDVLMKGRGKKSLNSKRSEISEFIRKHVSSQYISPLRPSEVALGIVDNLIEGELSTLDANSGYKQLMAQIKAFQQPILDKIAEKLRITVADFIPGVKGVRVENELGRALRTSFKILINDGAETELASKGDGIISLATMALMKHVSEESVSEESIILAIEEPESHLHPEAIHGLRHVLKGISKEQQVIITTHSPILVERENVSQNILVRNGRAVRANQIGEIREALGIRMADNLIGAYIVLLVEGEEDADFFNFLLPKLSTQLSSAFSKNLIVIDHLVGATNLHYKATFYKQNVYNIHAFLDNDDDGRKSIQNALDRKILEGTDYNLSVCPRMRDSELEDLLLHTVYSDFIKSAYGVNINQLCFRNNRSKWSDRVAEVFKGAGKLWNKSIKMKVKRTVIDKCIEEGISCLNIHHRSSIDALVDSLESKLSMKEK
jgi:putative ATP-dependent endonuclease of OLD family